MQAALLAEELDVDFGQFETSFGQPSAAYWNTAMADEGVPFMATDKSFAADAMRDVMGGVEANGDARHWWFYIYAR